MTLNVACYYATIGNNACAGGGIFDWDSTASCPSENGGTIIHDTAGHCFFRRNFGQNGIVDARQCGVKGDGNTPADFLNLKKCLQLASRQFVVDAYSPYSILTVTTGGGVILDNDGDVEIPANVHLTCGGTSVSAASNDDYRVPSAGGKLSQAIVIDPSFTVLPDADNSAFSGCTVEAGAQVGSTANPYSPAIYFPNCTPDGADCSGSTYNLRTALNEYGAFNPDAGGPAAAGTGVTISGGSHAVVSDVTVLGFGTCFKVGVNGSSGAAPGAVLERVQGDCHTGIDVGKSNAPFLNNFRITPLLTGGADAQLQLPIKSFGTSGSNYTATLIMDSTAFRFATNDTLWLATGIGGGRESLEGRWVVTDLGTGSCGSGGGTTCQTLRLEGSRTSSIVLKADIKSSADNGIPPNAIRNISTNSSDNYSDLQFVAPGQSVTGTCVPAGTTVSVVWPARRMIYLSANATCDATQASFTFADHLLSSVTSDCAAGTWCAFASAAFRFGDGVRVTNTGGVSAVNCTVFEHMIAFHFYTGSHSARMSNCATEANVSLPNGNMFLLTNTTPPSGYKNIVGLLIDGAHNGGTPLPPDENADACNIDITNFVLGQHRPVGMVVNSTCNQPNKLSNIGFDVADYQDNAIAFELDNGSLSLVNATGSQANGFKAAANSVLAISNNNLSGVSLYIENSNAAANISGCGDIFATTAQCANAWTQ